jgi:hypothetical protein
MAMSYENATPRQKLLASLATEMGLGYAETTILPTAVEVASQKVGMSEIDFLAEMVKNKPLRDYMTDICRSVNT